MKSIYLLRHSSIYNPNKVCYGQSEMPLEENFTNDFDWIKEQLALDENVVYYSSPLRRCTKLASSLSADLYQTNNALNEQNFGVWELKEWNKISAKEVNLWQNNFVDYSPKKGESFKDLFSRTIDFYEEHIITTKEDVVLITHAANIRSILSYVLGFPLENVFNLQVNYSSICKIVYDETQQTSVVDYINRYPF